MKQIVVDASVVAAAFFRETFAGQARSILTAKAELLAPTLIEAELANVICKRFGRGELDAEEAAGMLRDFRRLPLRLTPIPELTEAALAMALHAGRSAYDCLYVALAARTGCAMVTADQRLVNALARTPLAPHVQWLGETD